MAGRLDKKKVVITGGTSGIGLGTARLFIKEGARLAVCGHIGEEVDQTQKILGSDHLSILCDVTDISQIEQMVLKVKESFSQVDVVFANAGIGMTKKLMNWTVEDFDHLFGINARGQFFTVQKFIPLIRRGGVVILTSSVSARLGQANMALYAASKAVVPSLARNLSQDLLEEGIRVFCLTPGPTDTPIYQAAGSPETAKAILEELGKRIPIGRVGQPDELASVALFLASDDSRFMLGNEVIVDGGKSIL